MQAPSIAKMRHRIQLRLRTDSPAADFGLTPGYSNLINAWAAVEPVGAATYYGSVQTDVAVTHRFWLRYLSGIDGQYEIVHRARVYRVQRHTDLNAEQRFLVIDAEEIGPA